MVYKALEPGIWGATGDLAVVEQALIAAAERIDLDLIIQYAQRLDPTTCKRLGWHLSRLDFDEKLLEKLLATEVKGYIPIDPGGPKRGRCHSRWNILENTPGLFAKTANKLFLQK